MPPDGAAREEVVQLSPFVVNTDQDVGYLATNTLAGSRLNQSLKDTSATISVLTPEFLSDIGAQSMTEALAYATNVEFAYDDDYSSTPHGTSTISDFQTYRVRGLRSTLSRNYFTWRIPADVYNVERIEDARGPNSVLFGVASPGGVIDAATKRARVGRSFQKASIAYDSFSSRRAAIDVNRSLLRDKLAVRLNAVYGLANSFRRYAYTENRRTDMAVTWNVSAATQIRAEYEFGLIGDNTPRTWNLQDGGVVLWSRAGRPTFATPIGNTALGVNRFTTAATQPRVTYVSNDGGVISMRGTMRTIETGVLIKDPTMTDYSINIGGPSQDRQARLNAFTTYLDHRFSRTTFLQVAYNHQGYTFNAYDQRFANTLIGDPNQVRLDGTINPYAGRLYLDVNGAYEFWRRESSDDGRVTLSTEFDAGKWGNFRLGAFAEYEKRSFESRTFREIWVNAATGAPAFNPIPENAANLVARRTYVTEGDWGSYYIVGKGVGEAGMLRNVRDPVSGTTLSSTSVDIGNSAETHNIQKAAMVVGQARYFDNRLILAGGIRRDNLFNYELGRMRDPTTQEWTFARNDADADASRRPARQNDVGRTTTFGAVYHVTPKLSLYINKAQNVAVPPTSLNIMPLSGEPGSLVRVAAPKGVGKDIGVGMDLFGGRLHSRVTYFTSAGRDNTLGLSNAAWWPNQRILDALLGAALISQSEHERRWETGTRGRYDSESHGVETQITANPRPNWRLQANYSLTYSTQENVFPEWKAWDAQNVKWLSQFDSGLVTSSGMTIAREVQGYQDELANLSAADGVDNFGSRRHKISLFTRYNLPGGWLKGAYVGGGYKFQSRMFVGRDSAGKSLWGNSYWYADGMAGYRIPRFWRGKPISLQLNVYNVFNKRKPLIIRYQETADGLVDFREVVQPPTTWRFSADFEF